jgi:hypothetical protein
MEHEDFTISRSNFQLPLVAQGGQTISWAHYWGDARKASLKVFYGRGWDELAAIQISHSFSA